MKTTMNEPTPADIDRRWHELSGRLPGEPIFSFFENWPGSFFYIPVAVAWFFYALRYRSFTLPLLSNPSIEFAGLCGESKCGVLSLLGSSGKERVASYMRFENTTGRASADELLGSATAGGLRLPFVLKPDIGRRGTGVRIVRTKEDVEAYLEAFPRGRALIVQRLIEEEGEAGVMYLRYPGEGRGKIISLTLKYFPAVVGDGRASLRELILRDERARRLAKSYFTYHKDSLETIVPRGKRIKLVAVGNHVRGSLFRDGRPFITSGMTDAFDKIAREIPHFHLGRFDVRFEKLSDLAVGENFTIIEVNGAGSEATHIWDRRAKLFDSYRTLFAHAKALFDIGLHYKREGRRAPSFGEIARAYVAEKKLLASYPPLTE